jgi:acetyltransferase
MSIQNLDSIFSPRGIAVIGASPRGGSVGNTVLRNLIGGGFSHPIYPVNPKHASIAGLPCFGSVGQLPGRVDLAVICTPAASVPRIVKECGEAAIGGLVILSAGFKESSAEGARWEQQIAEVARGFPRMRIIGPNCLGVLSPASRLNASFASDFPAQGKVAFISQSGALCTAVLDWSISEGIGFSQFVSVGNMVDVGVADLIDYFATDGRTDAIILYLESVTNPRAFVSAARAFTRTKPIFAYKAGRFEASAKAAASHTGAIVGVDSVYEAVFRRAGIERVFEVEDLFDCAEFLAMRAVPRGDRLAIVTNAGGPGVMATDSLLSLGGRLAELAAETIGGLGDCLPVAWSKHNPVDVLGDATPSRFGDAVRIVLADPNVDGLLVILSPQAMTDPTAAAEAVIEASRHSRTPVLVTWMGGQKVRQGIAAFQAAGIPTYATPEQAIRVFMHCVNYRRHRDADYETPHHRPVPFALSHTDQRQRWERLIPADRDQLTESESKRLLQDYDIAVSRTELAQTADSAAALATEIGFPVVLKVHSRQITHKSDIGGVELGLKNAGEVADAFGRIERAVRTLCPGADFGGVTVQPMLAHRDGRELILGAKRDPLFGPVILVGAGGVTAELYRDWAMELPPLDEKLASRMLQSLRCWPLLRGYRGRPGVDVDRLIDVMLRFSTLLADCPEIAEVDINPLWVTPDQAIALDARVMVHRPNDGDNRAQISPALRRFSHLAIRPYPEEYVRRQRLSDGTEVTLRPIRPADEPLWRELMESCSPATMRSRYCGLFKPSIHEIAARYCCFDYDREMGIAAEITEDDRPKFIGVGRLLCDPVGEAAEFAVIVGDRWQGRGLGSLLMDHCLAIARQWGIRSLMAEVSPANQRMLRMFKRRGFTLDRTVASDVVVVRRQEGIGERPVRRGEELICEGTGLT